MQLKRNMLIAIYVSRLRGGYANCSVHSVQSMLYKSSLSSLFQFCFEISDPVSSPSTVATLCLERPPGGIDVYPGLFFRGGRIVVVVGKSRPDDGERFVSAPQSSGLLPRPMPRTDLLGTWTLVGENGRSSGIASMSSSGLP